MIRLEVLDITKKSAQCRVLEGGTLKERKGVNLPGMILKLPSLTAKDKKDLQLRNFVCIWEHGKLVFGDPQHL